MKNLYKATSPTQYPQFWNEEWLKVAINELDKKALTQEERLVYAMTISANTMAIKNENKKIEEAKREVQREIILNLIEQIDFDDNKIAKITNVSVDFVREIRQNK
jgi:predicted transcriptional regulator